MSNTNKPNIDFGYWVINPLSHDCIRTLRRAKRGIFDHKDDRLNIAFLIAEKCLKLEKDGSVSIAPKGVEATEVFSKD